MLVGLRRSLAGIEPLRLVAAALRLLVTWQNKDLYDVGCWL